MCAFACMPNPCNTVYAKCTQSGVQCLHSFRPVHHAICKSSIMQVAGEPSHIMQVSRAACAWRRQSKDSRKCSTSSKQFSHCTCNHLQTDSAFGCRTTCVQRSKPSRMRSNADAICSGQAPTRQCVGASAEHTHDNCCQCHSGQCPGTAAFLYLLHACPVHRVLAGLEWA